MNRSNCGSGRTGYNGSFTVEASLLMGVILPVLFLVILMTFYLTDTVRLEAVMAEDCTYTVEEETARNSWFRSAKKGFFLVNTKKISRSAGTGEIRVSITQNPVSLGFGCKLSLDSSMSAKVRDPVKELRLVQMAVSLMKS